jgi:hypothetical protein
MKHTGPYKLLDWERQSILDAYSSGEKSDAIGEEFGVNRSYPGLLAKRKGLATRSNGRPRYIPAIVPAQVTAFV